MKILIADPISVVRAGLRQVLRDLDPNVSIVEANDFILAAQSTTPDFDLVVIDLAMPGMDGVAGIRALNARAPSTPVVVFSAADDPRTMIAAIEAGARGYVPKATPNAILVAALRLALAGGVYLPPVASLSRRPEPDAIAVGALANLSRRQREILALVSEGMSNQSIGDRLELTLSTVKAHVTAILKILGVENRTQAVLLAKRAGGDTAGAFASAPIRGPDRELIARLNQELRGPLNAIIGFADIIGDELYGPIGTQKYVECSRNIGAAGRQLLAAIVAAAETERDSTAMNAIEEKEIDVATVIQSTAHTIKQGAKRAKVAVATYIPDDLPRLKGDEGRVRQIVLDLLSTAIRFTPPEGRLTVAAELDPDKRISIRISDIGPGLTQSRRRASDGLSRGRADYPAFAHVKSLVEMHGGRLAIDATSDAGAAVVAIFPAERTLGALSGRVAGGA